MAIDRVAVRGSERQPATGASQVGMPNPGDLIDVTLVLRRRTPLTGVQTGECISRAEFASRHGADPADVKLVEAFARQFDLTVVEVHLARRSVRMLGTIAHMNEAFATQIRLFQSPDGIYRGRTGTLFIPVYLDGIVEGVFGLDERTQAHTRFRRLLIAAASASSYTPNQVSQFYNYPTEQGGAGQTIGIIELGGGFSSSDLNTYFQGLGFTTTPSVTAVSVDGATNQPTGDPNSADGEVLLDIEVIGAIVPNANIVVYFAPNTDQGFLDAITTAVHDTTHAPSVISISWGGAESTWTSQALTQFDQAFQDAGALGVTVCVASGDDGSEDNVTDGNAHVDFPASSPNVIGCGGTSVQTSGGTITSEVVWNNGPGNGAGGGGVSQVFPLPSYQANAGVPPSVNAGNFQGRGVPDVCGDADPGTGYQIFVDGTSGVFGGTSAVAPLWAALVALINEQLGKPVGFFNPVLYPDEPAFNDITSGNNGAYSAGPGWDACTGLGSPNGQKLLALLTGASGGGGSTGTGGGTGGSKGSGKHHKHPKHG